jgi:CheY-like chemotaxis protein
MAPAPVIGEPPASERRAAHRVSRKTRPSSTAGGPKELSRSQRVLVVDDNRDMAEVLGRLLRIRGHAVEIVHDGPSALDAMTRFHPRFALLDIGLPEMNGYELARRLKKQQNRPSELTLVALTGYARGPDLERARRAGFAEHLVKPVDLQRLLAIIERQ